ncbi:MULTISPECIES: NADPH-dependent oxidoreductase [Metabacillus]|uniref:NADPH-dependent oxidoreductase n=2 Tax=Metabacillus TaxID=2675233 RepID=A0A179SVG4_9BACI|nr:MULTISPECIES: NADPH-dependent oxidoreductase [Metabacillus]OAS85268.1 NADPH-dependent oxidoreductase [Metabacillus litoralis]QNF30486.1 NADPH-dependent oxidoreductase [Metabacillus sp. KUDC1714]
MNEVIKTLTSHRSFRKFEEKQIENEHLNAILSAAQAAPTWIHGQQVSVIVVQNKERKQKLATFCGNQEHIKLAPTFLVFCADFNRAKMASDIENVPFEAIHDADILLVGATDVGIALSNAIAASESLGLGVVPIGGIRRQPLEVIELLQLPQYVIPIAGLCIGYGSDDPGLNPRLAKETFVHKEEYNNNQEKYIKSYNEVFKEQQLIKSNGQNNSTWTNRISSFYKESHYNNNYKDVPQMLKQQGFNCKDLLE